jgi:hypothetical protein
VLSRLIRTGLVTALTVLTAAGVAPATGAAAPPARGDGLANLPAVRPVMSCAAVTGLDLDAATDAPVTIHSATVVTSGTPYCEVRATIAPANTIVVRLPVRGWTQRYVQTGCGGLCGTATINFTQAATCRPVADGTVASATTDMGHQGQFDGSWAAGNPQAQIDFAYRGVHVTAQVAKALIRSFYGRPPAYSYFNGCSDGGREGLMAAQRFPHDFDGIAAGAPANNLAVQNTFHHAWNVLANKDADGDYILLADRLPLVHAAVLRACDDLDGVTDGVLDDPRRCRFDPDTLRCAAGQAPSSCLSPAEATVVRKLHDGAVDAQGRRLEPAVAHEWGSELEWTLFVPAAQGQTVGSENFALSYLRHLADPNHPDPGYRLTDLRFTVESFWRTVLPSSTYLSALDPDLRGFQRGGGRLLLWHGWNDQHIAARNTLLYYDAMRRAMGARTVDGFATLYLFPGMAHCGGGAGPNTVDVLTPVMAWVETGSRPGTILATNAARTRPVYPYPTVARYDGTGSTDDAANFVPHTPRPAIRNDADWVGRPLFSHGYQTWPRAVNGRLVL